MNMINDKFQNQIMALMYSATSLAMVTFIISYFPLACFSPFPFPLCCIACNNWKLETGKSRVSRVKSQESFK